MLLTEADRRFLRQQRVGHFATLDPDHGPHVVPICFAVYGDWLYFVVDEKPKRNRAGLKRLRNLRADPRVALVVDHYDEDWTQLAYIKIRGRAFIVDDAAEYARVLDEMKARYRQYQSMQLVMNRNPMVRIVPLHIHRWSPTAGQLV